MARNGTDVDLQTSGTGDRWSTAPALVADGLFLGDFGPDDADPDIGDSAITETGGLGGFAMAAAPAIVRLSAATRRTRCARRPGCTRSRLRRAGRTPCRCSTSAARRPASTFSSSRAPASSSTPTGIDVQLVARTGILPQINTGMADRLPGTGQVGAGLVTPPPACFAQALDALAEAAPPL